MHSNNYTLAFVFIITVLLGTILSFTKENLRELQEYNLKADMKKKLKGDAIKDIQIERVSKTEIFGFLESRRRF